MPKKKLVNQSQQNLLEYNYSVDALDKPIDFKMFNKLVQFRYSVTSPNNSR